MCLIAVSNSWLLAGGCYEAVFSVLNKIGNIPQAFILSLQLREAEVTDVERERDTGPPWHCHSPSIAGFAGASVSLWLALDLLPCSTNHPPKHHPSSWVRAGFAWGVAPAHRRVAALISPAAHEQIKVSHLSECRLHPHALFTASSANWLVWFADAEHPDLSSKVSAKPTSFDSEKTWLLLLLKCQHTDFRH